MTINSNLKNELLIVGDVHGKCDEYWKLIQKHLGESICVGDFGFKKQHEWHLKNIDSFKHKISFGNHDDTSYLLKPHSLGNFNYRDDYKLMTIRGAWSIDQIDRIEGIDWWADEELNYNEMRKAIDLYSNVKPNIVISHDCPHNIRKELFWIEKKSITSTGLQHMLDCHSPKIWVFGHHHKNIDQVINGTRYICLGELDTAVINKQMQYTITVNPANKYEQ